MGHYKILKVVAESFNAMKLKTAETRAVLAGLRRDGMLAYRPDIIAGKLAPSDLQQLAKELPEESHISKKSWRRDRYFLVG